MDHFYYGIEGWFDYQDIYSHMVSTFGNEAHFVEIGAWKGKSSSFMAVEIANSNKNIKFDVVDTWRGSPEHQVGKAFESKVAIEDKLFDLFQTHMNAVKNYYNPVKLSSLQAVELYADQSLDFVFIDASHEYEYVKQDILAWLPKVKKGGFIGGHDFTPNDPPTNGVDTAVKEIFGNNFNVYKVSWLAEVK
jgi:predicted O-methyltransferase YrrM